MENDAEQMGPLPESDLCSALGFERHAVHALRREGVLVQEGRDWHREEKTRHVFWTAQGQEALRALLGVNGAEAKKNGQEEADGAQAAPVCLLVAGVPKMNRRILVAKKKEGGDEVRVRVRDNINFMAGMEIWARADTLYQDVYTLEGRCPRYRGRW